MECRSLFHVSQGLSRDGRWLKTEWSARVDEGALGRLILEVDLHNLTRLQQSVQVDTCPKPHALQHEYKILSNNIARCSGRVGTTAQSAQAGIKFAYACFHGCVGISEAKAPGVMEVRADGNVSTNGTIQLFE